MDSDRQILVDTLDTGDFPPYKLQPFVEQLRIELPDYEVHIAWEGKSASHAGPYWQEIIIWVSANKDVVGTAVITTLTVKATEWALKQSGKVCVKLARFTGNQAGKVFKRVWIEPDKEPVNEDVSEDEQESVTKPPIRD